MYMGERERAVGVELCVCAHGHVHLCLYFCSCRLDLQMVQPEDSADALSPDDYVQFSVLSRSFGVRLLHIIALNEDRILIIRISSVIISGMMYFLLL